MIKNLIDANIELFTIFKTEEWDRCQDPNIIAKTFACSKVLWDRHS